MYEQIKRAYESSGPGKYAKFFTLFYNLIPDLLKELARYKRVREASVALLNALDHEECVGHEQLIIDLNLALDDGDLEYYAEDNGC